MMFWKSLFGTRTCWVEMLWFWKMLFPMDVPTTNPNSTDQNMETTRRISSISTPDDDVVIIFPPDISMELYRALEGFEKKMVEFFGIRKSFLDECAKIFNTFKDDILIVYGIAGGMGMLALLSCKDAFKGSIMMMVFVWIGVMFPVVVARMNLGLKMEESLHRASQHQEFHDEFVSWAREVESNPGNGYPVSSKVKLRVSKVKSGPKPLSLDEHYARIHKLWLMSIAGSFLISLAVYILYCKGDDEILGWPMWLGQFLSFRCYPTTHPILGFRGYPTTHPISGFQWPT